MNEVWRAALLTFAGIAFGLLILALSKPADAKSLEEQAKEWAIEPPIAGEIVPPADELAAVATQKTCRDLREIVRIFRSTHSLSREPLWTGPRTVFLWYGVTRQKSVMLEQRADCKIVGFLYGPASIRQARAKYGEAL